MNLQRTLYNPLCSLLLCDRHLAPHSKPVYWTVVLPIVILPTNLDSRAFFFQPRKEKSSGVHRACISNRAHFWTNRFNLFPASYPSSTLLLHSSRISVTLNLSSKRSTVRKGQEHLKICALIKIK